MGPARRHAKPLIARCVRVYAVVCVCVHVWCVRVWSGPYTCTRDGVVPNLFRPHSLKTGNAIHVAPDHIAPEATPYAEEAHPDASAFDEEDVVNVFSFARHNRTKDLERLLDSTGIPANVRDRHGNTILIVACQNGLKRIAKLALRRGADINARNVSLPTGGCCSVSAAPLVFVCLFGSTALVSVVRRAGPQFIVVVIVLVFVLVTHTHTIPLSKVYTYV